MTGEQARAEALKLALYRERTFLEIAKWSNKTFDHSSDGLFDLVDDFALYIRRGKKPE
jgi:hypothetical protein